MIDLFELEGRQHSRRRVDLLTLCLGSALFVAMLALTTALLIADPTGLSVEGRVIAP